jgi:outer membrane protein
MKYVILSALICLNVMANDAKQNVTVGFGPYLQSEPYKDTKNLLLPSPVIFFDNALFYVRWSRFGMYFLGEKKKRLCLGFFIDCPTKNARL